MNILKWTAIALVTLAVLYGGIVALGAWRWSIVTRDLVAQLRAGRVAPITSHYNEAELADLPSPVQRYFRAVLTDGQPIVTAVRLTQTGMFNMSATADQWKPFTATQDFETARPGFVWNATITLFPGFPVRVVDAFTAGNGLLRPTLLGLYAMGEQQGTGEIARGELLRHFAESVWFPTALLPSQGVVWQAVDDRSAQATMTDGPISVTMLFRFGTDRLISSIYVEGRATKVGETTVLMPWECRMSQYQTRNGMLIPFYGEALYLTPQGEKSYFRGKIDQVEYWFADDKTM